MGLVWGLKKFSSLPPEIEFQVIEMDARLFFCTERVVPYKEMEKVYNLLFPTTIQLRRIGSTMKFSGTILDWSQKSNRFFSWSPGISPEFFFTGVCYGGLITLSLPLTLGLFSRERPLFALATVATAVGIWTDIPYAVAACTALFIYLRHRYST